MSTEEECPHGLEREWCSLCKAAATATLPSGVKRLKPPPLPRSPRQARAPRPRVAAAPPTPRSTTEALAATRKVVFHASAAGSWPSILQHGLWTAGALAAGEPALSRVRDAPLAVTGPGGDEISIRDQRPMLRSNIDQHLDGLTLAEWLGLLNDRVFLFAQQKALTTLLSRYVPAGGQDVITFDTRRLLAAARGRVEVTTVTVAEPVAWGHCPCRGRATFSALESFRGSVADIEELAVVGGLENIEPLVTRVVRYHADRRIEVLVGIN